MPNSTQKHLLDDFYGKNGDYFTTIRDAKAFNLGTKVLYLERAIEENCTDFLMSLDKLYHPHLSEEAKIDHLECIRALKLINDICFNHDIKIGIHGLKPTLDFLFGALGPVNPFEFHRCIEEIVKERISDLYDAEVDRQKAERITLENDIPRTPQWRLELELPASQCATIVSNGALTVDEYQELTPVIRHVLNNNPDLTRQFVQEFGLTLSTIKALPLKELSELFQESHAIIELVNDCHISLTTILALEPEIRTQILMTSFAVTHLINALNISFAYLLYLAPAIRAEILWASDAVVELVNDAHIPFVDLLALNPAIRGEVLNASFAVKKLINEAHIPFMDLLALDPAIRKVMLWESGAVTQLINEQHISFDQLSKLTALNLKEVIRHPHSRRSQDILNPLIFSCSPVCSIS